MELDGLLAQTVAVGAKWSISIRAGENGAPCAEHCPSSLLQTASVAKIFILIELANRLARGEIDPGQLIDRRWSESVRDSGLWHAMHVDSLPVVDVAMLVGALSDNWAANALIDLCGLERIQALAAAIAPRGSTLRDYVRDDRSGDVPDSLSEGCAHDWAEIMRRLYCGDGVDDSARSYVLSWLAQDTDLSMVSAAFGLDPLAHDTEDLGLRLWHKTGTDPGVRAEAGVVRSSSSVVSYAVVCNWPKADGSSHTRRAVLSTMRRIGDEISSVVDAS